MDEAAAWLTKHRDTVGVRAPSVGEKARAVGLGHYFRTLALDEQQKADAVGNAKDVVGRRLEQGLQAALGDPAPPDAKQPASVPDMAAIQAIFEGVEAKVRAEGHNPQAMPFPDSLSEPA
eukprot:15403492-Alexandrium_andersonii.AAC.1